MKEKRPSDAVAASENERIMVAVAPAEDNDGILTLIVGIPPSAFALMQSGTTQNFDLTRVGIPVRLVCFSGADDAACKEAMAEALSLSKNGAFDRRDMTGQDMGISVPKSN